MKENYFDSDLEPGPSPLPELHPKPKEDASKTPANDDRRKNKRQFMGYDLSMLLIAGGVVVALLVYAVWPDEPLQRTFVPDHQAARVAAPAVEEAPAPEPEPSTASASEPEPPQHAEPVLPVASPVDTQAMQQASEASQQETSVLNGRVSDAERRLAALEARMKAMGNRTVALANAVSQPVNRITATSTPAHRTAAARTGTVSQRTTGVQGWRVHTIYPGMAWITHGGTTWSVQAGDNINGMTIRSINATARTVTTDRGVIRQGD